ncbi:MAG TPA: efflux RND transporter periplasmic adaptor subunit [Gemmatimonadaceae bacterium]|jgi:HlyD family secretion protein
MKKLKLTVAAVALASLGGTAWFYQRADGKEVPQYKTAALARGSLKSTVSATGTLQAVRTVQVGTQASGQVSQIYVDFNDQVKKGQLLARIDPTLQQQAVEDAQAQLDKAQATLTAAQEDYNRNKSLFDARVLTAQEFETSKSNFSVQTAAVKSAQIAVDRAKQNLSYTSIYSPIDGVIVERNVDVGQTVAASLSAPQLFLIANDLSEMQILASVDESDIGQIKDNQPVQFTVQSYPGQQFSGTVKQVRLQSTTTDNVVNYTAVVAVKNDGGKLLPGMTATVAFTTASATDVLTVPSAALRIKPTAAMLSEAGVGSATNGGRTHASAGTTPGGASNRPAQASGQPQSSNQQAQSGSAVARLASSNTSTLWYLDASKTLHMARVQVGLSDGTKTEVTGKNIQEGMQVVVSVAADNAAATTASAASSNPFTPQRGPGGPGGPPGGASGGRTGR